MWTRWLTCCVTFFSCSSESRTRPRHRELGARGFDRGDLHARARVGHELHETHRVVFFLIRLAKEMGGKLRERLAVEMRGDGDVLQHRAELAADLLVDGIDDSLAGKHACSLRTGPTALQR
jgi:hypothetical protein